MLGAGAALGVLEQAMRAALTSAGARLLETVLAGDGDGYIGPHAACGCGRQARYVRGPARPSPRLAWVSELGCKVAVKVDATGRPGS